MAKRLGVIEEVLIDLLVGLVQMQQLLRLQDGPAFRGPRRRGRGVNLRMRSGMWCSLFADVALWFAIVVLSPIVQVPL